MKKEFGKWLLDVAKYLVTAILISSVFKDMEEKWITYLIVIISASITLGAGLWMLNDNHKKEK